MSVILYVIVDLRIPLQYIMNSVLDDILESTITNSIYDSWKWTALQFMNKKHINYSEHDIIQINFDLSLMLILYSIADKTGVKYFLHSRIHQENASGIWIALIYILDSRMTSSRI